MFCVRSRVAYAHTSAADSPAVSFCVMFWVSVRLAAAHMSVTFCVIFCVNVRLAYAHTAASVRLLAPWPQTVRLLLPCPQLVMLLDPVPHDVILLLPLPQLVGSPSMALSMPDSQLA